MKNAFRTAIIFLSLACALATCPAFAQTTPSTTAPKPAPPSNTGGKPADAPAASQPAPESKKVDAPERDGAVPLAEIQRFVAVYRAVKQAYVDKVGDRKLMQASVRGLLTDLDPHSAYLDKAESEQLDQDTNGAYEGIGVEVMQLPDRSLRVVAPIDGTPAARAGIKAGDVIVAIDGKPIDADNADSASISLRGPPGSVVKLGVLRDGADTPTTVVVKRDVIKVQSVRTRLLEPGYGYVRLSNFQIDTATEMARQIAELVQRNRAPLHGIVLDLRSNPGGLLDAAVEAADDFLDSGTIVSTKGRLPSANATYTATPGDLLNGAPIVVLIDGGTASASEVLAGALHDSHRALIVGSRSFGKGSVQTILPLDNGDSIKLTTARYYTPSGRSIQARGIRPDLELKPNAAARKLAPESDGLRERDLPGHLAQSEADDGDEGGEVTVFADDYAIAEGLKALKKLPQKPATQNAAAPAPAKR